MKKLVLTSLQVLSTTKRNLTQSVFSIVLLLTVMLISDVSFGQPTVLGSQVVNGTYSTTNLTTVGGFKQVRLQATSSAASGARNWEFATGTAAATVYTTNWRPFTGGNVLSTNTFIPTSFANGAKYNTGSGGASGLLPAITVNSYYTFNVSNNSAADNVMSLLETTYNPVTISSTTRYNNTVNIVTSSTPNAAENIYVRYTTNAFVSSTLVQATGSGTNWNATIPLTSGSVTYYIYTSNRTKAAIDNDVTTYGQGVHDMSTLSLLNNAQANYVYTAVSSGIASNAINDTNPSSANPYTNGQYVITNATASGIGRAGATASSALNRYSATTWPTAASIDLTKYFEFTITPNSGYRLNFTDFTYTGQVSSGTPTVVLRSSVDGYASNIGTAAVAGTTISLSAAAYQAVTTAITFRYYAYGLAATTTTLSINDYTFNGTVDLVPSNPSLAITGTTAFPTTCPSVASSPITYTITNSGPVAASSVTVVSSDSQFVVSGLSSTTIAASGGTATYQVTFTPSSAGAKTSTVTVASTTSGSNSPTSSLTGTGATAATAAVTTTAATAISTTAATLNGNVNTLGVCPNTSEKGFVYSPTATNAAPIVGGTGVIKTAVAGVATGVYSLALSGLTQNTGYSFSAYVYDGISYTYGSVLTFSTTAALANDDCSGAINLTVDAAAVTGTFVGSTPMTGATKNDVFYMFTPVVTGTHTITINTFSVSGDRDLYVYSVCPSTYSTTTNVVASGISTSTTTESASGTFTAGTSYKILVQDFSAGSGTFNISVTGPPATLAVSASTLAFGNQNVLTNSTSQTFNLSGTALTGSPGVITVTAPNTNFQVSNNNSTWGGTTTIAYSSSTLTATPVYVRFTPQSSGAKTGNITFSGGGALTPPTVALTGTGLLPAPVATAATNIATTLFDANWGAVTGATGYFLDVSTSATFGTSSSATLTEGVESGGLTASYQSGTVSLASGSWTVVNALKASGANVNTGTGGFQLQGGSSASATAPALNNVGTVTFYAKRGVTATSLIVQKTVLGITTTVQTIALTTSFVQYTVPVNDTGSAVQIGFLNGAAVAYIDDVTIGYINSVPSFVTGYNNLSVGNVTTYSVTGLTANTTYYYRVRATDGSATSANSNTITVTPASIGGTVTPDQTICSGTAPTTLTLAGNNGSILRWESSTDAAFTSPVTIANTTTILTGAAIGNLTTTTYFRAVVQNGNNPSANSGYATITVTQPPTYGNLQFPASATICATGTLTAYGRVYQVGVTPGAGAGAGITAQFGYNATNTNPSTWTSWSNATYNIDFGNNDEYQYTFSPPSSGTFYYTFRYRQGTCGWIYGGYTAGGGGIWDGTTNVSGVLTVNPLPTGNLTNSGAVCAGTQPQLTFTATAGIAPFTLVINGQTYNNISSGVAFTATGTAPTTTTTYTLTSVTGVNCSNTSPMAATTVTVNPLPTGNLTNSGAVCAGTQPQLTFTATAGTAPFTLVINGQTYTNISSGVAFAAIGTAPTTTTTYTLTSVTGVNCSNPSPAASTTVTLSTTTSTDGGITWDNGTPTSSMSAVYDGSTGTIGADFAACSLRLTNNATVAVTSGFDVTLNGAITVDSGSTFILNNNANLLQSGTTNSNSGNIVVKRNSSALKRLDYTLWSSPVTGQGVYAFSPSTFANRFYVYRTATNFYNNADIGFNITGLDSNGVNGTDSNNVQFALAKGYLIRMPWDHPTTATIWNGSFTGVPNNGDVPFTMANNGSGFRFNLTGNPYPSPISMTQFVADNSAAITGTLYFWRETNGTTANNAYCSWAGGTFVSNNEAQVVDPNGIIRTGQGFFVEALNNATALTFNNGQRSTDNSNQFFRPSANAVTTVENNRFWLNISNAAGEFSQMAAGYMTDATDGVDLYDGKNINTGSVLLNSILDNTDYTIQGKSLPFSAADVIPLSAKITNAGEYRIGIDHVDGLFTGGTQAIYLKDNLTATEHNLQTGPYTFTAAAGTFNDRFEIRYQSQLGTNNPVFTANNVVIYSQNNVFVVNSGNIIMSSIKVFDIRGRLIEEKKAINASQTTINGGLTNEVLLVQITSEDGTVVTKKVVR